MIKLWQCYKPFINAGAQELITYRVNFILYRIGHVMGAFVAFYLWKAESLILPRILLIQGFSMADITLYIITSFVTNLLTRSDSSFMIDWGGCKGGFHYHALIKTSAFFGFLSFYRAWFQMVDFYLCWPAIFKCDYFDENLVWTRHCRSAGIDDSLSR